MPGRLNSWRSAGFTLIEVLITIVLIGMLAAVGSSMIADAFTTTGRVNADNASTEQARYVMERLAREIREIKYSSSGGNYCITTPTGMTATNLVFSKTSGSYDPTCATNAITVTVNKSGSNLTLGYSSPAVTSKLGDQVSTFTLSYLDIEGNTTTSNSAVKFVVITLERTDPTSGQTISQRTRIALRNGQ